MNGNVAISEMESVAGKTIVLRPGGDNGGKMTKKEAAEILKLIRGYMEGGELWSSCEFEAMDMAINELGGTVEEIRGTWNWVDGIRCSRCNYKLEQTGLPGRCPNCGAIMTGESYTTHNYRGNCAISILDENGEYELPKWLFAKRLKIDNGDGTVTVYKWAKEFGR